MFKHLLVPIDGSDVTKKSLKNVLDLAKKDGASITLVYVSDPMPPMVYSDSSLGYGFSQKDHKKACDAFAKNLFKNALAVLGAGVTVKTLHTYSPSLAGGVLAAAKKAKAFIANRCDLHAHLLGFPLAHFSQHHPQQIGV